MLLFWATQNESKPSQNEIVAGVTLGLYDYSRYKINVRQCFCDTLTRATWLNAGEDGEESLQGFRFAPRKQDQSERSPYRLHHQLHCEKCPEQRRSCLSNPYALLIFHSIPVS